MSKTIAPTWCILPMGIKSIRNMFCQLYHQVYNIKLNMCECVSLWKWCVFFCGKETDREQYEYPDLVDSLWYIEYPLYRGFLTEGYTPKSSIYRWIFHETIQLWGYPHWWKPPHEYCTRTPRSVDIGHPMAWAAWWKITEPRPMEKTLTWSMSKCLRTSIVISSTRPNGR